METETKIQDSQFLALLRAAIAARSLRKKVLARRCHVSPQRFSEMLTGDREMPIDVRERLIRELGIGRVVEWLTADAGRDLGVLG